MVFIMESINRTIVELKLTYPATFYKIKRTYQSYHRGIEIVDSRFIRYSLFLSIVPSWNWNASSMSEASNRFCLSIVPSWNWNVGVLQFDSAGQSLSIVPSWNWNVFPCRIHLARYRTINRTIVELKSVFSGQGFDVFFPINRTIVELKWFFDYDRQRAWYLSIVPSWNWNTRKQSADWWCYFLSIVPSWNWN